MKSFFLTAGCLALLGSSAIHGAEMRNWKDTKGREVRAEMTGVQTGSSGLTVMLELESGKTVGFPLQLLSAADQKWVQANLPFDAGRAANQIDALVWNKLREANAGIKTRKAAAARDARLSRNDRLKKIEELSFEERLTHPTKNLTDEQFLRRIYLDIAGRIPTYEEATAFLDRNDRGKRSSLIDSLLDSPAFTSHFFNYLSDLLRARSAIQDNGSLRSLQAPAYHEWLKDQISQGRPWDELVTELLTAAGPFWENPATGYLLTDFGMPLCNLSNNFTVFMGTEITCAQCHDHPFEEVYQMDFYKMAAFFGELEMTDNDKMRALRPEIDRLNRALTANQPNLNRDIPFNIMMGTYRYHLEDGGSPSVRLPHDYKYDDGEPLQLVQPSTYFGEIVELEKYETPRAAFAQWMTSVENPRFTINLVNRLWKFVFGLAQIEPVHNIPGHLDGQAQNYELLKYLEQLMKDLDYDVKNFLRVLYQTQTYQREACPETPTLAMIDRGEYHFPAPILRRLSAEQMWDSLVALTTNDPDQPKQRITETYREMMNRDWSDMSGTDAARFKQSYRAMDRGGMMGPAMMDRNRVGGETMVRASEMQLPAPSNHFLYAFGQSDKQLIENGHRLGSVPQVLMMLNGKLSNQVLSDANSRIMQNAMGIKGRGDTVDAIFLSILSRRPTSEERSVAQRAAKADRKDASVTQANYANLIWALLNTREFMFIQ